MPEIDLTRVRLNIERRNRMISDELHRRYLVAQTDVTAITNMIKERYNPRRICQRDSLLNESMFSEISDIDIAVEGIGDAETFFKCAGEARAMTELPLDIVEIEKIAPEFRKLISTYGKCIYDRKAES